jgi:hypothetical protein
VSSVPVGPAAPVGGWALEYGDGFGAPLGAGVGQDNTVWPSRVTSDCVDNPGFNGNELEVFNCSQVTTDANGLELNCSRAVGLTEPFSCGAVSTVTHAGSPPPAGYRLFNFMPGQGQEWAMQIVTKFPPSTGDADPGWWATTPTWQWEWDMFEGWGATAGAGGSWCQPGKYVGTTDPTFIYSTGSGAMVQAVNDFCRDLGFDPSAGYHTYTTVMYPDRSMAEWIDGRQVVYTAGPKGAQTLVGPPAVQAVMGGLIVSYSLRNVAVGSTDPYFPSGTRNWSTRSIAVYENATAAGANTVNPGIAPGTQIR